MKKITAVVSVTFFLISGMFLSCTKKEMTKTYRVGISMALFADNFLTYLREAMNEYAGNIPDLEIFVEDAKNDVGLQLAQVENFIAQNYDAVIVNPADTEATDSITEQCVKSHMPLVYVNRMPETELPSGVVFVGSDEVVAGREQAKILAEKMGGKGNIVIMLGELSSVGTRGRTKGVKEVLSQYPDIKLLDEQTAIFQRSQALDLMSNWLLAGYKINAVAANNDEMALGTIMALKNAGLHPNKDVFIGGVDATPDALDAMKAGELTVTVFQNAKGQGEGAVKAAYALAKKEHVDSKVWIPFEPVTEENYKEYRKKLGLTD